MKRKWMTTLLIMILICLSYQVVYAEKIQLIYDGETHLYELIPISLHINGELTTTTVMPPVQIEGNTLVPAREVFSKMGAEVLWKAPEKSVYITKGDQLMVLTIDSKEVWVDGEIKVANVPAKLINDKVMIPLRFISEALGFKVNWISETNTITIEESAVVEPPVIEPPVVVLPEEDVVVEENEVPEGDWSEIVPEETPELSLGIRNITYDSNLNALILEKAPGLTAASIIVQDNYIQRQIKVTLPTAYTDFYGAGVWEKNDSIVKQIQISQLSSTEITLTTTTIKALEISEDEAHIYLRCVKPKDKYSKIVVIDAGHGKADPGATYGSIQEKDINLRLALQLQQELYMDPSIKVYMIREGDTFLTTTQRAAVSNEIDPDLYISIHVNSYEKTSANGTETFYTDKSINDVGEKSKKFAKMVQEALVSTFGTFDRGTKNGDAYVVIRDTNSPAILIEIGFLTNTSDRQMMLSEGFEQKYAMTVYNCIQSYYTE